MKLRLIGLALAGLAFLAVPANAMVLSLTTGGTADVVPADFNPTGFPGGIIPGASITVYGSGDAGSGLFLSSAGNLRFEYLGSEASLTNVFNFGGDLFSTAMTAVSTVATVAFTGGSVIPFTFVGGNGDSATNGGPIDAGVSIAFADLGGNSFLAMFNDGGSTDLDYDDLVVKVSVSQVALPPAIWLLISAGLGLVSFSRIRRNGPHAA